jgi:very-short-patch-repair endonuclease
MWNELKGRRIKGYQFMRQKPIGKYIADFFCSKLKLVIEIDGESHGNPYAQLKDEKKDKYLCSLGLAVLRYDDGDIKTDISGVIDHLIEWIELAERRS